MRKIIFILFLFSIQFGWSQTDSSSNKKLLEEIVVTSNRTATKKWDAAIPIGIVSKKYIQLTGSLKLQDILQEQTGITIVNSTLSTSLSGYPNPFGQGIQMEGLDPAYTAVLVDGEPLIGRNAGILKLGRIATGNISQIEIAKGPTSCLYGSEALAGVINIITEKPTAEELNLQLYAAGNSTFSQTISYSNLIHKTSVQAFVNRYSTEGYDLDPSIYGKTIDPYTDWNACLKINAALSKKTDLLFSLKNYYSKQTNDYQIYWQNNPTIVNGYTTETDKTLFVQLKHQLSTKSTIQIRTYFDNYNNTSFVNLKNTDYTFDETSFDQTIIKPEIQLEHEGSFHKYILGGGTNFETIDASRYAGKKAVQTTYAFSQNEWYLFQKKLVLNAGIRIDKRTDFDANLSPRISTAFKPNNHIKLMASAGYGFKAPDFRHMYLSFNNSQIGYALIGNNILAEQLESMQQNGVLDPSININPYLQLPTLLPEKSFGTSITATYRSKKIQIELSVFRNDIDNLIDVYILPFTKMNNGQIYSYHNVNKIFTQGINAEIKVDLFKNISLFAGYQYLEAKDKSVLDLIRNHKKIKLDPITFRESLVSENDYIGLPNRSAHTFTSKILWQNNKYHFDAFLRISYRGPYGYKDINGDDIIDDNRELASGYTNINFSARKQFSNQLSVQIGVDNAGNYTNPVEMPNIAGRIYFINFNYSINQLFNKSQKNQL